MKSLPGSREVSYFFLDEKRKEAVTLGAASLKLSQIGPSEFNFGLGLPVVTSLLTITDPDDKDTPLSQHVSNATP
jgi:hypothetical protein